MFCFSEIVSFQFQFSFISDVTTVLNRHTNKWTTKSCQLLLFWCDMKPVSLARSYNGTESNRSPNLDACGPMTRQSEAYCITHQIVNVRCYGGTMYVVHCRRPIAMSCAKNVTDINYIINFPLLELLLLKPKIFCADFYVNFCLSRFLNLPRD